MDEAGKFWYFPAMSQSPIPAWNLYGENSPFPDLLHIERIVDRAAGLDWRIAPHRHLHLHQVFLLTGGGGRLSFDGVAQELVPPVLVNLPRGVVHGFAFAAGTEGFVMTLPAADFPELFGPEAETAPALAQAWAGPVPEGVEAGFAVIAAAHEGQGAFRRLRLRAAALDLGCAVAEAIGAPVVAPEVADPRMARFEALIRRELGSGWQLADYARELGLSERHLRRLCRGATGLSAHAYLEGVRLREACRLLAYTRMQVQEVGFALGFDDPAYFGRVFARVTGLSPGAYRARLEG